MPQPLPSSIRQFRPFVAAKDWHASREFYLDFGFEVTWQAEDDSMNIFKLGDFEFYLQNFYVKDWAENSVYFLEVEDVDAWWQQVKESGLIEKYPSSKFSPPHNTNWGAREFTFLDPAGVLWHIAKFL